MEIDMKVKGFETMNTMNPRSNLGSVLLECDKQELKSEDDEIDLFVTNDARLIAASNLIKEKAQ